MIFAKKKFTGKKYTASRPTTLGVAVLLLMLSYVPAEADDEAGTYYGLIGAVLHAKMEFTPGNVNSTEENAGYKIGVGYRLSDNLELELSYDVTDDYKEVKSTGTNLRAENDLFQFSALTKMQWDDFEPYVRIGIGHGRYNAETPTNRIEDEETDFVIGLGTDYELNNGQRIRLDFARGNPDGSRRIDQLVLGFVVDLN